MYKPNYKYLNEIYIDKIIFEPGPLESDVTIFGYIKDNIDPEVYNPADYCCDFSLLNDLLAIAGESAEPIIDAIATKLNAPGIEDPIVIDLEEIAIAPLKIDFINLKVYKPKELNADGKWMEDDNDSFYLIESLESGLYFGSDGKEHNYYKDLMADYMILLSNQYALYREFCSIGLSEKRSRKKSGLSDDILFKLAFLNFKITNDETN
ncbi:hypothetical protein [Niabella soli]|uniref:Uncharacterized protein n=1 Tax=Niabella soli DSM 19437 TaxID=929713 RepID=W0F3H9_9BACT|nr:hypothetical protein [Niabella soli]AHF17582.1 hypothetical protein NIASO_10360 [Niabella soli DSM 19437]